jgi:hypothetical protein
MPNSNLKDFLRKADVEQKLKMRNQNATFIRRAFACFSFVTVLVYVCQGLQFGGFHPSEQCLSWLGATTVSLAGLLAIVVRQK